MKNKLNVSIGIPAFNEERNMRKLLTSLLSQKQDKFKLLEIIVVVDGSTDNTEAIVRSFKNPLIRCISYKRRRGQQARQNEIVKEFSGDVLVFLEADLVPYSESTIDELVWPFYLYGKAGMVIGAGVPLPPRTFYESILYQGTVVKMRIFNSWKSGINVYSCGGHSMKALSRAVAKKILWPCNVPEDAYTYLRLKQLGIEIRKNSNAKAYIRNVTNFKDRIRQCKKFHAGKHALEHNFTKSFLRSEYSIPKKIMLSTTAEELIKDPLWTTLYLLETALNRIFSMWARQFSALYPVYNSSKSLLTRIPDRTSRYTITVGIPAYNEEKNIVPLVRSLLRQQITSGVLTKLLVISDGSTDKTTNKFEKIKNKKFKFIDRKERLGLNRTQNEIIKNSASDILVLLDADVLPADKRFIDGLIEPFISDGSVGLTGAKIKNVPPTTLIEKILSHGQEFKNSLFEAINGGENIYICHGRARAFKKELYENIIWQGDVPEDAYSYLSCVREGFRFAYAKDAVALFRLPMTLSDHIKQTKRFESGKQILYRHFSKEIVINSYQMPLKVLIKSSFVSLLKNPLLFVSYAALRFYVFHINKEKISHEAMYDVSVTTKNLGL